MPGETPEHDDTLNSEQPDNQGQPPESQGKEPEGEQTPTGPTEAELDEMAFERAKARVPAAARLRINTWDDLDNYFAATEQLWTEKGKEIQDAETKRRREETDNVYRRGFKWRIQEVEEDRKKGYSEEEIAYRDHEREKAFDDARHEEITKRMINENRQRDRAIASFFQSNPDYQNEFWGSQVMQRIEAGQSFEQIKAELDPQIDQMLSTYGIQRGQGQRPGQRPPRQPERRGGTRAVTPDQYDRFIEPTSDEPEPDEDVRKKAFAEAKKHIAESETIDEIFADKNYATVLKLVRNEPRR